jgi:hypothetical protein
MNLRASSGNRLQAKNTLYRSLQLLMALCGFGVAACGGDVKSSTGAGDMVLGQSDFESVSPTASSNGTYALSAGATASTDNAAVPAAAGSSQSTTPTRTVEETDLYRLEGTRLYYLNGYRGLMVFDVSNVDAPKLLGRSPIFGDPIEMIVRNGFASVVVADWYGTKATGEPFHGSIVRGIDATDPTNMKITGEAQLGGNVRDTRVVGDVLYAVTEQSPYDYGWYAVGAVTNSGGVAVASASSGGTTVAVTSVNIAGGAATQVDQYVAAGQNGVFNVDFAFAC